MFILKKNVLVIYSYLFSVMFEIYIFFHFQVFNFEGQIGLFNVILNTWTVRVILKCIINLAYLTLKTHRMYEYV